MPSPSTRDKVKKRRYKSSQSPEPEHPRFYVSKACEACRTRKAKCSGGSPACSNCTKHGRECVYLIQNDGRKLRGKAPPNQVETLRAEIRRLEQALEAYQGETTGGPSGSFSEMELGHSSDVPPDLQTALTYSKAIAVPIRESMDDHTIEATNSSEPQDTRAAPPISLDGPLPVEPFSTGGTFLCPNGALHLHAQASLYQGMHITPEQMAETGHKHAMTHRKGPICKPWHAPYIPLAMMGKDHQTILELGFQAVSFALSSGWKRRFTAHLFKDPENRTSIYSPFLHLVILAYGWRYCQDYPIIARYTHLGHTYAERGYMFAESARRMTEAEYASPKICTVVGLDLLAMFLAGTGKGIFCGPLHSIATHYTQEFRLNRKCDDQLISTVSGEELDVARRDAFTVNRIVSSWWTSNFGRTDLDLISSADQRPPVIDLDVDDEPLRQDGMVLQHYFELATKSHTIYDALHVVSLQPTHRIEVVLRISADMDAWYNELPSSLKVASGHHMVRPGVNLLALLCLYQTYRILIYRPFCAWQPGLSNLLPQAMEECKTAADNIMQYVRTIKGTNDVRRVPYTLQHALYVAGTALLLQCSMIGHPVSLETSAQAKSDLAEVIDVLDELGEVWPSASTSAEALRNLRGVWAA